LAFISSEWLLNDAVAAIDDARRVGRARVLSRAQQNYFKARRLYSRRAIAESASLFAQARDDFSDAGSPMALVAEYYEASAAYDSNRGDEAIKALRRLFAATPPSYRALKAQLSWEMGTA